MLNAANIRGPKFDGAAAQRWLLAHGHLLKPVQQQAFADFTRHRAAHRTSSASGCAARSSWPPARERFAPIMRTPAKRARHRRDLGCIIAAEIGPFDRFPNADALEFWAGMTADLKESAGRTQSGNITKAGSRTLALGAVPGGRHALPVRRQPGSDSSTTDPRIGGKAKANVAMGRRLLRILYAMVRDDKTYRARTGREPHRGRQQGPRGQTCPQDSERRSLDPGDNNR